ncbi:MAG: non-canonical purine NTP pyrophosphatase [bacterium (Candidatus Ratteibacteria) CG_4_10_14_3_um_filter_41_18]|uniref:dITP/XTP pyrophosphatase n=4 Tax=Candidatus Ratteibacteria TaxID=2979319 RepID=A0A2M7E831_9BACT|nr:MAG: non-canonical purine NTP pyrophosphatase, RdgB/HAM1 family [Candidatus Omnitrophica bacterium CG1_02_41_171]PIV63906.1 MAG: non-canonical purine NTP pyrophosphatase [bacterium (Candidatus Ratteibacteria) CG01_land_8_20_14_3_00_40_19]PIW32279.1 MAG: non-canonical purine NTP pyrophosphatase [bacterium (Candidatus Ratteibacteria) CG15_BIG_FIL_POST_REV_8_21_14_020_41_12]PIW74267.1 MAG: non-canonical purine NTP pyrophosphatase [bacterium (Candidatus Ratteibacteria) CG_4_8_14_3_um_filter_41_36
MKELVLASRNKGKAKEIKEILKHLNLKFLSLKDFPGIPLVKEDCKTFRGNAVKKSKTYQRLTKKLVLAEDSGLQVDALDGDPGVYSARFAGKEQDDKKNIKKLLKLLKNVPEKKRKATFKSVIAITFLDGKTTVVSGAYRGWINFKAKGKFGFGYDPVFVAPRFKKTFAELSPELKNRISHRAKALKKAKKILAV